MRSETILIINETNGKLKRLPFLLYKDAILGKKYLLNVIFVASKKMRSLNKTYRHIDAPTDILSFPIDAQSGEIFICQSCVKTEAKKFERTHDNFLYFLIIHGMVHLSGYDHGRAMEAQEKKYRARFGI